MSMKLFNVFNEFKNNDYITTIFTYSDKKPCFFPKKTLILKSSKKLTQPLTFSDPSRHLPAQS